MDSIGRREGCRQNAVVVRKQVIPIVSGRAFFTNLQRSFKAEVGLSKII
jgi:hypothetical protein